MAAVTALRATKRGGIALHVDGAYVCTVSESLVARWPLDKGRELDDEALAQLQEQASAERVVADAYRLLGHRARSRLELERRLLQKGHTPQAVAQAVERLQADGHIDDARFARSYVADKRKLSGWGSERIRRGLAALGVDGAIAEEALEVRLWRRTSRSRPNSSERAACCARSARRDHRSRPPSGARFRPWCAAGSPPASRMPPSVRGRGRGLPTPTRSPEPNPIIGGRSSAPRRIDFAAANPLVSKHATLCACFAYSYLALA